MRKMSRAIAVLLAAGMVLGGCGNSPAPAQESTPAAAQEPASSEAPAPAESSEAQPDTKELTGNLVYWSMWNDTEPQGEVWQAIADGFMKEHPDVKVTIQWCGRDIKKILKPALDGGEVIDVFEYPLEAEVGDYVMDLTDYVQKSYGSTGGEAFADTLLPSMLVTPKAQTGREDMLPAVGYKPWMQLMMYNKTIFDEAGVTAEPRTWAELDAACAKIKEAGYSPITFDDAYASWLPGIYLARAKGQEWVQELVQDTTGEMWKDEAVVNMAKAFEDFAKKGYFDGNVGGNKWPAGQMDVGNGKVAMYYNLTGLPTEVADVTGPDFKWGGFSFPDVTEGAGKCGVEDVTGCTMLSMNKNTADPELAMEFIAYALSRENDGKMVEKAGTIPATLGTQWPASMENLKGVFEGSKVSLKVAGDIGANADLTPFIAENFIKLAAGQISADEFVSNMAVAAKQ